MDKEAKINRLDELLNQVPGIRKYDSSSSDFIKWRRDAEIAIEKIFGSSSNHVKEFNAISYDYKAPTPRTPQEKLRNAYFQGLNRATSILLSMKDEIERYYSEDDEPSKANLNLEIERILNRFHQVVRQFRDRYGGRPTIDVEDEYDVQDILHSLLTIYFDDIRKEEYTPSHAGQNSRVDFLLKAEQIVIEVKKTRKGLAEKEVKEQLIIDISRYQSHPDCKQLICFVYDPEARITNPRGLERDLSRADKSLLVQVFVRPIL